MKYSLRSLMPKRSWFQFSLKTVMVGMTMLCIGPGGYVAYQQSKARSQKAAVEAIEKLDGIVEYGEKVPVRTAMLRQVLGDESFGNVYGVTFGSKYVTDEGLIPIAKLTRIKRLILNDTRVTDAGLVHLVGLKGLTVLNLENTQVTNTGLEQIADLSKIEYLSLDNTLLTDTGLAHLSIHLKGLESLFLKNTRVTDAGLVHLAGLNGLKELSLINTQVTDAGVAELQKALPNCEINPRLCVMPSE
jgi:hypothetical protein